MHDMRQPLHGLSLMLDSLARLPQDEAASEIADVMRSAVGSSRGNARFAI